MSNAERKKKLSDDIKYFLTVEDAFCTDLAKKHNTKPEKVKASVHRLSKYNDTRAV